MKKGVQYPEIFQLVSLFEENIGPDRLSDMVATIIYPDIVKFTKRIQDELGISKEKYSEYIFREDGLAMNCPVCPNKGPASPFSKPASVYIISTPVRRYAG